MDQRCVAVVSLSVLDSIVIAMIEWVIVNTMSQFVQRIEDEYRF